jgi:hypothetical protein
MTTSRPHRPRLVAIHTRIGQGLAVTALMAGLAIGAGAVANAVPSEWDIEEYDKCTDAAWWRFENGYIDANQLLQENKSCCITSVGVLGKDGKTCGAPPLYPGPQGPVAEAPTEASQPPAPAKPVAPVAPRPTVIGPG